MGVPQSSLRPDGDWDYLPSLSVKSAECFGANKQWLMDPPTGMETSPPEPLPNSEPMGNCWNCTSDTPIMIDLGKGTYELTGIYEGVTFDLDADGELDVVSWTAPREEIAFLSRDVNRSGTIENGAELFGTATRLHSGVLAANGYEALVELDENHDGWIDVHDGVWRDLLLWVDRNHNGTSEPEELTPIAASDIVAISTDAHWSGRHDRHGNRFRYMSRARIRKLGAIATVPIYDVYLLRGPM